MRSLQWKQNVISWGEAWIRKIAFPLQKLHRLPAKALTAGNIPVHTKYTNTNPQIYKSSRSSFKSCTDYRHQQQPASTAEEGNLASSVKKFSDHQLRDHDSLTESWERNGLAVTPVGVLLRHPGEQPRHVLGEEQRPLFQLLTSFRFGHHCTYRVPPIQDMSQIAAKFSFYFTMISFSGSNAFGPAVGPRLAGGRRCTEAPLGLLWEELVSSSPDGILPLIDPTL